MEKLICWGRLTYSYTMCVCVCILPARDTCTWWLRHSIWEWKRFRGWEREWEKKKRSATHTHCKEGWWSTTASRRRHGLGTNECRKKWNETSSQEFNGSSSAENGNMKTNRQTLLHMNDESRLNIFEFICEIIIIVIITWLCCHGGRSTAHLCTVDGREFRDYLSLTYEQRAHSHTRHNQYPHIFFLTPINENSCGSRCAH